MSGEQPLELRLTEEKLLTVNPRDLAQGAVGPVLCPGSSFPPGPIAGTVR